MDRNKLAAAIESIFKDLDVFPHPVTGEKVLALPDGSIETVIIDNVKTGLWEAEKAREMARAVAKTAKERGFDPALVEHFTKNSEALVKIIDWAEDVRFGRAIDRDYRVVIGNGGYFELLFTRPMAMA